MSHLCCLHLDRSIKDLPKAVSALSMETALARGLKSMNHILKESKHNYFHFICIIVIIIIIPNCSVAELVRTGHHTNVRDFVPESDRHHKMVTHTLTSQVCRGLVGQSGGERKCFSISLVFSLTEKPNTFL